MPFGDYDNFADCVAKNTGKVDDPEAYCATIKRAIEESAPPVRSLKLAAYQAMKTRALSGVELFRAGKHTDAAGQSRNWSAADLTALASSQSVPLKVGHTSDSWNARLADGLGVPVGLLTGEAGNGAARLGRVTNYQIRGDTLTADFEDVPETLADLIEGGQFNAVSVEIGLADAMPHLTAVALLGSQSPAVPGLKPLNLAHFSEGGKQWITLALESSSTPPRREFARGESEMFNRDKSKQEEKSAPHKFSAEDVSALYSALELAPSATVQDIVEGIRKLQDKPEPDTAAIAKLQKQVEAQEVYITRLEHRDRVVHYSKLAEKWTAIPGKPDDLGEQLAKVHESAGEETAKTLAAQYQQVQDAAQQVGLLSSLGTARIGRGSLDVKDSFDDEIEKYAAENKLSFEKALAYFAVNRPKDFAEYRRRVRIAINGS